MLKINTLNHYPIILPFMLFLIIIWDAGCGKTTDSGIITYPSDPALATSDLYTVTVNGQSVWTEKYRTDIALDSLPEWFTSEPYTQEQQELHISNFSCTGPIHVRIEIGQKINQAAIRPVSRKIKKSVHDRVLEFILPGPDKLYIEINNLPPLCFFANPAEFEIPDKNNPHLHYFGPGIHQPGLITLKDNDELYIAGGAVLYGGIRIDGASNIRVTGRGILDGGFRYRRMVYLKDASHVSINGIIIRNGRGWTNTLVNCSDVTYRNVKVLGFGPSSDGINPLGSKQVTIDSCFLRCTDDCIAIKSPDPSDSVYDIQVINNTMIGYAFSDGVTIGFETNGPEISDVTVRNCDILIARGGSRVDGHSAFSIICDGPAEIHNITYEDIHVEERVYKLFELQVTDGTKYGINPPGHIRDVYLKNVSWAALAPIILKGYDTGYGINNVTFENCYIQNKKLTEAWDAVFEMNHFVHGVKFK